MNTIHKLILMALLALPVSAWGGPSYFNFDGVLVDISNNPLTGASLKFDIYNPAQNCLLYEETVSPALDSQGNFSVQVGNNTPTQTPISPWYKIFDNSGTLTGVSCSYTPVSGDARILKITVTPFGGSATVLGTMTIASAPMASMADNSEALGGVAASNYFKTNASVPNLTQPNLEGVFSSTNYPQLLALLAGTSTKYMQSSASGAQLPSFSGNPSTPGAGDVWYDSTSSHLKYYDGTSVQTVGAGGGVTSITAGAGLTGATITSSGTIALAPTGISSGSYTKLNVDSYGRATAGSQITGADIISGNIGGTAGMSSSGNISLTGAGSYVWAPYLQTKYLEVYDVAQVNYVKFIAPATFSTYTLTLPPGLPSSNNYALVSDTSGNLTWQAMSGGGGTPAGSNGNVQYNSGGAFGASANFNWSGSSLDVTGSLRLKSGSGFYALMAPAAANNVSWTLPVTDGSANQVLTTDGSGNLTWTNAGGGGMSNSLNNGFMWVGNSSNTANAVVMSGDATLSNTGILSLKTVGASGNYINVSTDSQGRVTSGIANGGSPGAVLDIMGSGAAKSSIIVPRDVTVNRPAGINGMMRYNTSIAKFEAYENNAWVNMIGGGGGTPAGSNGNLQYNNGGAFTASSNLNWSGTSLDVTGTLRLSSGSGFYGFKAPASAGNVSWTLPVADGSLGQVLTTDGSGNLTWTSPGGGGTVTSVGLVMPSSVFTTGGPVTGSGNLSANLQTQAANTMFAAPIGSSGIPSFRMLAPSDLPSLPSGQVWVGDPSNHPVAQALHGDVTVSNSGLVTLKGIGSNGQLPFNNGGTMNGSFTYWDNSNSRLGINTSSPTGALTVSSNAGSFGQLVVKDPSNTYNSASYASYLGGYDATDMPVWYMGVINNAGNSVQIGGYDASHGLSLETNQISRIYISPSGNVGVGTTNPFGELSVTGSSTANPAISGGSDAAIVSRVQAGTIAMDMGVSSGWHSGWIQTRNASINGTIADLSLNPYGGNVQVGINSAPTNAYEFAVFQNGASNGMLVQGSGPGNILEMQNSSATTLGVFTNSGSLGIGTSAPSAMLDVNGPTKLRSGLNLKVRVVTAAGSITVIPNDYIICVNKAVGAATTVTLPSGPTVGDVYVIKDCKGDASVNNITVMPTSGNIDGTATFIMSTPRQSIRVFYDGTQWEVF